MKTSSKSSTVLWSGNGYHCYIPSDSKGKVLDTNPKI